MPITNKTNWELVVSGEELKEFASLRLEEFVKMCQYAAFGQTRG